MRKIINSILLTAIFLILPLSVSFGASMTDPLYLISGGTSNDCISTACMTDSSVIVAFRDLSDSNKYKAVLATYANGSWNISTPILLNGLQAGDYAYTSITKMTSTTSIIAFMSSWQGKAVVATITDNVLSVSDPQDFIMDGSGTGRLAGTRTTDTTAIFAFSDINDSNKGKAIVATLTDGALSMSAPTYLMTGGTFNYNIAISGATSTTAIIAFCDGDDANNGKLTLATITEGVLVMTAPIYVISGGGDFGNSSLACITNANAIIVYTDSNDSVSKAAIITISGGVLSVSNYTPLYASSYSCNPNSISKMNDTSAIIAVRDGNDTSRGKFLISTYSNGTLTLTAPTHLTSDQHSVSCVSTSATSATFAAIAFNDVNQSNKGRIVFYGDFTSPGYSNKVNGVDILKVNGVTPAKINGI